MCVYPNRHIVTNIVNEDMAKPVITITSIRKGRETVKLN